MMPKRNVSIVRFLIWPVATLLVLAGLAYGLSSRAMPDDVARVNQRIRETAYKLPMLIGQWYGKDVPVPVEAVQMLEPNVLISRLYQNLATGQTLNFLLIHCSDARDMENHYPANCYPANGWKREWAQPRTWEVDGMTIPVMEYGFRSGSFDHVRRITVTDFMILPHDRFARDMGPIHALSGDPFGRFYGAAQVEFLFDANVSLEDRKAAFKTFVEANKNVIEAVLHVGGKEPGMSTDGEG